MRLKLRPAEFVERYALVMLLVAECVFFTINSATPAFSTTANVDNILSNQAVLGTIAIATVIPLVANQIDLSVGPTAGLSSLLCAGMMTKAGWPLSLAILVGIGTGVAVGLANGLLVSRAGINSIVATLGTSSIVSALVVWYSHGVSIVSGISPDLLSIGHGKWIGLPKPFFILLAIAVICWYVLRYTPVGRHLYAVGSSQRAAELVGLSVPNLVLSSFVAAGAIGGACGVLLVATQGGANPQVGATFTLPAVAAAFLGATAIQPGRYNVWGTFTAVFFLAVSVDGLTLWGVEAWVSEFFNGIALIVAVGITVYSGKRRTGASSSGGEVDHAASSETGADPPHPISGSAVEAGVGDV